MIVVGLVGKGRSGKTTVAEHWRDRFGFEVVSFADALKEMVMGALRDSPPPLELVYWPNPVPEHIRSHEDVNWRDLCYIRRTPFTRWILQWVGTDIFRNRVQEEFWTERGMEKIDRAVSAGKCVVVPDVRFVNEATAIALYGGGIMRISRPAGGNIEHGVTHASELEMDLIEVDREIENTGTVDELKAAADAELHYEESLH